MQTRNLLGDLSENILETRHREATDLFCRALKGGTDPADAIHFSMSVAAPYLNVPAHALMTPEGDLKGVNYDHTILGAWRAPRMSGLLPEALSRLPFAQAMWYIPQGLDVWHQVQCEFPGHYAEKCESIDLKGPTKYIDDYEPLTNGSFDDSLFYMLNSIIRGDRVEAYRRFLGLADEAASDKDKRAELESTVLHAGLMDLQDTLINRSLRNIGHKALRARAMVDLSGYLGWERARPLFQITIPDLASFPRQYELYEVVSNIVGSNFGPEHRDLKRRNTDLMTKSEVEEHVTIVHEATAEELLQHITALLEQGKSLVTINDANILAAARYMAEIENSKVFISFTHVFDYANVAGYWLRRFDHPHQAKVVYQSASFCNDVIESLRRMPPAPDQALASTPAEHMGWARALELDQVLVELDRAIVSQAAPEGTALVDSYMEKTTDRQGLVDTLVAGAAKFEGDPHIARNAMSHHEEYLHSTLPAPMTDAIFRSWVRFLTRHSKRSYEFNCYGLYQEHFASH